VTFAESITTCFSKYATFTGRATRPEYWWFALFTFAGSFALSAFAGFDSEGISPPEAIFTLATLLPGLAVTVRRLHDTNRSAWYLFILLIPFGVFVLLWMFTNAGSSAPNTYGEPPDFPIDGFDATAPTNLDDPPQFR